MSRSEQAFFLLLRSGLWESDVADLSLFPLTPEEWTEVLRMSEQQTVQGLLYRGFQHLPEHLFPPQQQVWRWVAIAARLEKEHRLFCTQTAATYRFLKAAGASPILQKGLAVAQYYEQPALRVNGDIDWYVGKDSKLQAISQQLTAQGYTPEQRSDRSVCFYYEDTEVELHPQLIDLDKPSSRKAVQRMLAASDQTLTLSLSDVSGEMIRVPSPMPTLVMLNAHLMKHAFTVGVGLRQVCDMARAYHRLYGLYDANALAEVYHQTGLWRWSELLHLFLVRYLGMPAQELPPPSPARQHDVRRLLRQMLHDGNFGHHALQWQRAHSEGRNRRHTIWQIVRRMPFSLRYAPIEMLHKILALSGITYSD